MARCRVYRSHRHSLGCGVSSREVGLMVESAAPVPGRVFISYRREETAYPAGWLYDRLANRYGGQVFKDVDSIQLGDDFVEVITRAVGSCDVLLALIGDQWLTITGEDGRRRLDDPDDFVRLEIEAALTRNVRVIPILVEGARLPRADELPPSLARLVRRQALELSPARFDFDTSRLLKVLDKTLAEMRTAHDSAAAVSAPAGKAADSGTAEPPRAPEQREQAEPSPTPSIQQTPATPPAVGPASEQSKPPDRSTTEVHEASERRNRVHCPASRPLLPPRQPRLGRTTTAHSIRGLRPRVPQDDGTASGPSAGLPGLFRYSQQRARQRSAGQLASPGQCGRGAVAWSTLPRLRWSSRPPGPRPPC
jgi:TIR domain